MMDGGDTGWRNRIYGPDWRAYRDPEVPEYFNPTTLLLDRNAGGATARKTALIVDGDAYDYAALLRHVCRAAAGLTALGIEPGSRMLMFGTDSLEYVATWLGAIRAGIVPVVISDAYKAPNLLYFIRDTAAKTLHIDAEQLDKLTATAAEDTWALRNGIGRRQAAVAAESGDMRRAPQATLREGVPTATDTRRRVS